MKGEHHLQYICPLMTAIVHGKLMTKTMVGITYFGCLVPMKFTLGMVSIVACDVNGNRLTELHQLVGAY